MPFKIIILFLFVFLKTINGYSDSLDSLLNHIKSLPKDTNTFNFILTQTNNLRAQGKYHQANSLMNNCRAWVMNGKNERQKGLWLNAKGLNHDYDGKFDSALYFYNLSLKYSKKNRDYYNQSKTYMNIGIVYMFKGDNKKSLENYLSALKIAEKHKINELINSITMNIGGVYYYIGDYKKAYKYFSKRLLYVDKKDAIGSCYYNLASIHFKWKKLDSAEYYSIMAMESYKSQNDILGLADVKALLGAIRRNQERFEEAAAYYSESLALSHKIDAMISPENYLNASLLYAHLKNKYLAYAYADTALMIVKKTNNKEKLSKALRSNAQVKQIFGDYKEAYENIERTLFIRDSIFSDEKIKEIQDLKNQYDLDKKADEIKLDERIKREKQKATLEAKAKEQEARNRIILLSVISILIIIAVFAFIIFQRFKVTKRQNEIINKQKKEVELQKEIVEEKNEEILASINYAKRIQTAILPPKKVIEQYLKNSFILYKPKDIVAGDFYWLEYKNEWVYFAAADCTGHGVPGAMVSVICNNGLNRSVREYDLTDPGMILDKTREIVISEFEKSDEDVKDGMDISLCALSLKDLKLKWAGANNPLWIIRNNEIIEIKPNKQPIGKYANPELFFTHEIHLQKGDSLYVFTDGYQDQFGGEKGKKFRAGKLKEVLLSIQSLDMEKQQEFLNKEFESWRGELDQIDDVCIIGVKI